MSNVEEKSAYPYITKFKKEPFKSFINVKRQEIRHFYYSQYNRLADFYQYFNQNLLNIPNLDLEIIFWFLLLRKYLKEDKKERRDEIFNYIKKCEVQQYDQIGFKLSPTSPKTPDIYSTYLALSCLKILGLLKGYIIFEGQSRLKDEIKNFLFSHKKGNTFLHCHDDDCDICKKISPARTLYYILEIFTLLGIDVRINRDQFGSYLGDKKKELSLIFRYLCLKFLDLDLEVKDKEIQFLQQLQTESGGFSFNQSENISTTFWMVYVLEQYSWLLDYNPIGIYSFINKKLKDIIDDQDNKNSNNLKEISKLIILLSLIWKKFIDEIERVVFRQLEKEKYVDLSQLKTTFRLTEQFEEVISYINLSYNFKLTIIDNEIEFKKYISNLSHGKKEFLQNFYDKVNQNSIVSLSELFKQYRAQNYEPLRLKEDIFPIIKEMISKKYFQGSIRAKKAFLGFKTKYYFYLNNPLKKIIISDVDINRDRLYEEKGKVEDFKNDIYNMTLKLKNITFQIQEEIDSYLLIDEINYAKERLKFVLRNALMEADFLNENIENSFNEVLTYINFQAVLGPEINLWNKTYAVLQNRLSELDSYLKAKIQEKEELRDLTNLLDILKEKVIIIEEDLNKQWDSFKKIFSENLEKEYSNEKFYFVIQELNKQSQNIRKYDDIIYKISQQVTTKEKKIVKKHKKVIDNWIRVKEKFETEFDFYAEGFQFFNDNLRKIEEINELIKSEIERIDEKAKNKISSNQFQDAFNIIKKESDILLEAKINEIKELQSIIKKEVKAKHKLYLLYRHLQDKLESLDENVIDLITSQVKSLKTRVIEERNRAKIEDFDNFISQEISNFKSQFNTIKKDLDLLTDLKVEDVIKTFDNLQKNFNKVNKTYLKKLNECSKAIEDFREKSKLNIVQWEKFNDFFNNEVSVLRDDYINDIISNKINIMAIEKKTNNIKLIDLKNEVKLSCKVLIKKLKVMIDISKINAELNEEDKALLVYTDYYYLNRELKNFLDNRVLKSNREKIGKILALFDSSIRNKTLNVNMLELQNRIKDLTIFNDILPKKFYQKAIELKMNQERDEFLETKSYFESILENDRAAIKRIKYSLDLFNEMQGIIAQKFNTLNIELKEYVNKVFKGGENQDNYLQIQESFENKQQGIMERLKQAQDKIEEQIMTLSNKPDNSIKLVPEIRELYVKQKNNFLNDYDKKLQKINDQISTIKNESFRDQLLTFVNNSKIQLSQLLGNLERRVEDNIEIREFKKSNLIVQKRAKIIEVKIKEVSKNINNLIKDLNRKSNNFNQISKFIHEDFEKFIHEFTEILSEKVKSMERLILKSYIDMTIKAVSNEYLTISFLNNELKIKKQNIQDQLLYLISVGELDGKYDTQFGIYYENPEILDEIDLTELEVIKSTNFKVNMVLRHLKNFASQYGSIIAFFASIITITYYLFLFSGGNPVAIVFPLIITILILSFYFLRKGKEGKIK
ncbi:MAG: hypothetical protein JSV23_11250 [Promethearchaeota archaeon]|nr:MAG: hypothetical protein JSV23_11250 [Candidatus Lokiarchaeota archaeon]